MLAERGIFPCQDLLRRPAEGRREHYNGREHEADPNLMDDHSRLNTFLQGIEPRAWVFLHVHCDDPARADQLFRDTLAQFARECLHEPLGQWPMRFWKILLAQPGLTSAGDPGEAGLARMPPGPRAVFLLPMVAGLDEAHATEALGISSHALARALVQARMAWPDTDGHERLRSLLQARIRQPTDSDRKAMAALRADALGREAADSPADSPVPGKPRRPMLLAALAALVVLALAWWAVSYWSSHPSLGHGQSQALPTEAMPPPPPLDPTTIVTHPDYLALASPEDVEHARDLALLSWFDADAPVGTPGAMAAPVDPPDTAGFADLPEGQRQLLASARATWANLDVATRRRLQAQAADWLRRPPGEREALRQRMLAWDRLSVAERARRRAPFDAWQRLTDADRDRLRLATQRWSALPSAQQIELRAKFDALDADSQRLWWLGPTLGKELAPLAARLAFLPETERDEFLATLRGLDSGGRSNFIALSEHLQSNERERLRRDLQAQPPELRNAWLQAQRTQ